MARCLAGRFVSDLEAVGASTVPSAADVLALKATGCAFGAIACHDGSLYAYRIVGSRRRGILWRASGTSPAVATATGEGRSRRSRSFWGCALSMFGRIKGEVASKCDPLSDEGMYELGLAMARLTPEERERWNRDYDEIEAMMPMYGSFSAAADAYERMNPTPAPA